MNVCVLYNNPGTSTTENISSSDDDTGSSAQEVSSALVSLGHTVSVLGIDQKDIEKLNELRTDLVFNLIEWSGRETEDAVSAIKILEDRKIKFTGCGSIGYRLSSDKTLMKQGFDKFQIPSPKYQILNSKSEINSKFEIQKIRYPVIVKPAMEHCAIGIDQTSVVNNDQELSHKFEELIEKYQQPVIVEEFIDGPEAHVTVLEKDNRPWVLPPAVFEYKKKAGYFGVMTYEAKWNEDSWEAGMTEWVEINSKYQEPIVKLAEETFLNLRGRTHSRVDMRIRGDEIFVLEINNNPGLGWDEDSGMTYSCKKAGLSFRDLIENMVNSSL